MSANGDEKSGAKVTAVNDGQDALATELAHFDLILSDIFMPNMDGYAFARSARAAGISAPIVGLTAATIGEETDQMLATGADAVLSKPVKLQQLLPIVNETLGAAS